MGSHEHSSASVAAANRATAGRVSTGRQAIITKENAWAPPHLSAEETAITAQPGWERETPLMARNRARQAAYAENRAAGHEVRDPYIAGTNAYNEAKRQQPWEQTYNQYSGRLYNGLAKAYNTDRRGAIAIAERTAGGDAQALRAAHLQAILDHLQAGGPLSKAVWESLTPPQQARVRETFPERAPTEAAKTAKGGKGGKTGKGASAPEQAPKASGRANGKASAKVISGNKDYPQLNGLPQSISGNKVYNELVKGSYIRASIVAGFPPEPMEVTMRVARTGMRSASNDVPLLIEGPNNFHVRQDWETNQIKRPSEFPEWTKSFTYIGKVNPQTGELIGKGSGKGARSAGAGARAATAAQSKASKAAYDQLRGVINPSVFGRVMKLSIYRDATARVQRLVGDIESLYRAGSLDHNMDRAAYALSHAVVTGRANSDVSRYIKSATGAQLLQLVADINARVIVPQNGDMTSVGRYLNYTYRYDDQGKRLPALKGWEQPGS